MSLCEWGLILDVRQACAAHSNSLKLGFQWKGFTTFMNSVADRSPAAAPLYNYNNSTQTVCLGLKGQHQPSPTGLGMRVPWVAYFCSVTSQGNPVCVRSNASMHVPVAPFRPTIVKKRKNHVCFRFKRQWLLCQPTAISNGLPHSTSGLYWHI